MMKIFIRVATILSLVMATGVGGAEENRLRLTIKIEPEQVILGMPVTAKLELFNNTNHVLQVPPPFLFLHPDFDNIAISISEGTAPFRNYRGPGRIVDVFGQPTRPFGVEQSERSEFQIFSNIRSRGETLRLESDFAFPRSGTYRVRVRSQLESYDVTSNTATVTVLNPTGDDIKIWEQMQREPDLASRLETWKKIGPEDQKRIELLLAISPNGSYSSYLRSVLEKVRLRR